MGTAPPMEFRHEGSRIIWRYNTEGRNYPGFDDVWMVMSEADRRDTLRLGGRVAEWIKAVEAEGRNESGGD